MRAHDTTRILSTALLAAVLLAGIAWSGCLEQTPLDLPTNDICGTPNPGDTIIGETKTDIAVADTAEDTLAEDTTDDTPVDTPEDTPEDTPVDTPADTPEVTPDVCQPDCDGKGCGAPDGCDGFCPGDCDPGWVCEPSIGDCVPSDCVDDGGVFVVTFPDAVLELKVNAALGTTGKTVFTWDDVEGLAVLDANYKTTEGPIGDLTGLGCLLDLEVLWMAGKGDAQPPGFNMDISPLANLGSMTHLDIRYNRIASIGPLLGLSNLLLLGLEGNDLGDEEASTLADAAFHQGLLALGLSSNNLMALPNLQAYESLNVLDISDNRISDLDSLTDAAFKDNLVILHADENRTTDGDPTTGIETLAGLEGYFAQVAGPIPDALADYFQDWRNKLTLYSNRLVSLDGLETMFELQVLEAADNQITDLAPIQSLSNLTVLGVSGNDIADLPPDIDTWPIVPPIVELDISWNPLLDHFRLGYFAVLEDLNLEMTELADLNFMNEWGVLALAPPIRRLVISINPFAFGTGGSPLYPLAQVGQTLEILNADLIFNDTPAMELADFWLPDAALVALEELHLASNGLTGENITQFSNISETIWAPLIKLYLPNNQIKGGLVNLTPLMEKTIPLQVLDLSGNTITACQNLVVADEDWVAVCELENKAQTFLSPAGCDPCP